MSQGSTEISVTAINDEPGVGPTPSAPYDDRTTKAFLLASLYWGGIGMLVGLILAVQLAWWPANLNVPWLSFGRLRPLHTNAVIFAFAGNAIFAGVYYSTQRLCRVPMWNAMLSKVHFWGWQLIIVAAAISLPLGLTQGKEYAELIWPIDIAVALIWVVFAINFFGTVATRKTKHMYVALWFYIATIITIAVLHIGNSLALPATLTRSYPIYSGVTDGLVQWWYGHNAVGFLLTTPFLGMMYYFLPKAAERPVYSYRLSIVHFWGLVFLYIWAGPHHLLFSSLPDWAQTLGSVFSLMLIAPSWGGMLNGLLTLRGAFDRLRRDPVLKFFVVGITFYGMSTLEGPLMSLRPVNALSHYTDWTIAHVHGGALGWVGFTVFATFYYLVPKLWKRPLHSVQLATTHFWVATIGILLYVVAMWTAGVTQGLMWRAVDETGELSNPSFVETVVTLIPYYWVRALGGLLYLAGLILMAYNIYMTIMSPDALATKAQKRRFEIGLVGTIVGLAGASVAMAYATIEEPVLETSTATSMQLEGVALGRSRFERMNCAQCHGPAGVGGIPNTNYINGSAPALNTLAERMMIYEPEEAQVIIDMLESGADFDAAMGEPPFRSYPRFVAQLSSVRDTIVVGRQAARLDPNGPDPLSMPAWGSRLDQEEIDAVIAYLISLYPWDQQ
jgi:cbb3-type cytochrome c oxidase subunit I